MFIDYLKRLRDLYLIRVKWSKYTIGKGFHAGARVSLWARDTLIIGDEFYIGRDSLIETDCIIGNHVMLGNKVAMIGRYDHNFQQPGTPIRFASQVRDSDYKWRGLHDVIIVEDDVWIGYGTVVMGGVWIGNREHYSIRINSYKGCRTLFNIRRQPCCKTQGPLRNARRSGKAQAII